MWWLAVAEDDLPAGDAWLSEAERSRAAAMRFTKRRTEYRLRRLAAKRAVAACLGLGTDPADLRRVEALNRPGGAPFVRVDGADVDLRVSLTDRSGYAVCLLEGAAGPEAGSPGVDLEVVEPRTLAFVADYCTAAEQQAIAGAGEVGSHEWDRAANLVWSAKEAALKVLRVGLRADTRSVEVVLGRGERTDGWHPLGLRVVTGERLDGWWRHDGAFVLTLAARRLPDPPEPLPGGADLSTAVPVHSWLANPLAD